MATPMLISGTVTLPKPVPQFNVRVYGIWINKRADVLISEELVGGKRIQKFPGGGLQFGEGLAECLKREWAEETGLEVEIMRHYYTTDFFQPSAYRDHEQVISVYYLVRCPHEVLHVAAREGSHRFRWVAIADVSRELLSLPIDQHVAESLRRDFAQLPVSQ